MTTDRDYQPSLLWAKVLGWIERTKQPETHLQANLISISIYRTDGPGAYLIRNGRLYWDENLSDDHYTNCDHGDLLLNREVLGEVVVMDFPFKSQTLLGSTFDEAVETLSKSTRGRPPLVPGEKSILTSFLLPESIHAKLGEKANLVAQKIIIDHFQE